MFILPFVQLVIILFAEEDKNILNFKDVKCQVVTAYILNLFA